MVLIDVWISDWEIGCCRTVPAPGEPWSALLVLEGMSAPSGGDHLERLPDGAVSFAGPVVDRTTGWGRRMTIVRCGGLHVFVDEAPDADRLGGVGRLYEDNHPEFVDDDGYERWKSTGVVHRLWVQREGEDLEEVAAIDRRWVGTGRWTARAAIQSDSSPFPGAPDL